MAKKFNPIRMTASTEEAAIEQALMLVGATRDEVQIEVVEQTDKKVTIRIAPQDENQTAQEMPQPLIAESDSGTEAISNATPSGATPLDETPAQIETGENPSNFSVASQSAQEADAVEIFEPLEENEALELPPLAQNDEEESVLQAANASALQNGSEGTREYSRVREEPAEPATPISEADKNRVLELARTILQRMDLDAHVEIGTALESDNRGESRLYLDVDGEDVGILIGKHGQTLQAFQYILNVTANNGREEAVRVTVDAGGYRARRAESLESMAQEAAARAQRDKRPVRLEPMPAHERRVVHMILERIGGVSTSSEGREPLRHIVVLPAGVSRGFGGRESSGYRGGGSRGGNRSSSRGFRGDR